VRLQRPLLRCRQQINEAREATMTPRNIHSLRLAGAAVVMR
jgi:hypothetical protein